MTRSSLPGLVVLAALFSSTAVRSAELPTAKPADVGMSASELAKVDAVLEKLVADERLAGVTVAIARKGHVVHLKSFGQMDREQEKPMRPDTIHRIYSMSKAITSAAALVLVDEGKLSLDDPVAKFIPEMEHVVVFGKNGNTQPKRPLLVRDLFLHTAGFGYGRGGVPAVDAEYGKLFGGKSVGRVDLSLEEFSKRLADVPLYFGPGTNWHYGVSIDVLGRVVEVAGKTPFEEFLAERIFEPLDMHDTGFHVPKEKLDRFAANYNSDGKGTLRPIDPPAKSPYLAPPKFASGGGGLVSTARDYLRFLEMVRRGGELDGTRILSEESVRLMTSNQLPKEVGWIKFGDQVRDGIGFGCGFCVRVEDTDWDPAGRAGEYGWGGAASTHYWVSPKDELTVVTLEQTMPYSFMTEFAIKQLVYDAIQD